MKRLFFIGLILVLCLSLCSCGSTGDSSDNASDTNRSTGIIENEPAASVTEQPAQPSAALQNEESNPGVSFPFEDDEGRTRYRLVINGTEVETKNYPFTLPDEPNGGYYPIEDVLNCFGVACLTNEDESACATVIKGIACGLNNLQKIRNGEPLGGKASAENDFASDDDEDFLN